MECVLATFVVLIILVGVIRTTAGSSSRAMRRRTYQNLAREFSGVYISGGLFGTPKVRFRYGETIAFLTEVPHRGRRRSRATQIQIHWPDGAFVGEIIHKTNSPPTSQLRGVSPCSSGDEDFDERFLIQGEGEPEIRRLLSDGVRWQLDRLARLAVPDELHVVIAHGLIRIRKPRVIRKFSDLKELLQRALELYDQAMITRAVGIVFIDDGLAQTLDEVICKVCGDEIATDMVYCQRCKTPHHGECWHYAGACSVYGCQEKSYSRPQSSLPVNDPHTARPSSGAPADRAEGMSS